MGDSDRLEREMPAVAESVPVMRHAVAGMAQRSGVQDPYAVALAVSEVITNVVLHAYPEGEAGVVELSAAVNGAAFSVAVRDRGAGMRPRTDSPGLGLGLAIAAHLASALEVAPRPGGGTTITMRFPIQPSAS